ncbi:hypothetical protein [Streptomyces atratus]|uniref:hypothetical protein n=1 Tax=Streptomyces atratus TaxID=1893 RepID=UPI0021A33898|nr:hypothetical protein [Streptomyces atratus]MCT2544085.1 hypothetical protein [Streptomyces atratus]
MNTETPVRADPPTRARGTGRPPIPEALLAEQAQPEAELSRFPENNTGKAASKVSRMVGQLVVGAATGSESPPRRRGRRRAGTEHASSTQFVEVGQALSGESVEQVGLGGADAGRGSLLAHLAGDYSSIGSKTVSNMQKGSVP